ncbi:glutaredoxin-3-like [Hydractinia symbiolongicarpus]|uniref:glutaredoxin-3-like n=1 Tax=Hydractinia symbiolongicarpus TaxID=13093 RepID=UPI00254A6F78|nr:glutaredoxin-3-like [Hydractinia symbiolongicarpus]
MFSIYIMAEISVCKSEETFKALLKRAASQLLVLHFEAEWAEECKQMNEVFTELSKEFTRSIFARVEAEDVPEISQHYEIECVPTFIILKELKVIDKIEGADAGNLSKRVKHHATSFVAPVVCHAEMSLEDRLKKLINAQPCILFMKGSPSSPKCGFSRQIIEILQKHSIKFGHFDILTDNEVRQGLKKFSEWPTYPQLYSNGELIGGLDIVKELEENDELEEMLPKAEDINTRLSKIINRSPVMIFMKGDPQQPRCKFSRALMEMLNKTSIKFDSFDIFEDEEVRQGLKTYSNWPTYPQIYVKGELIGGLDILKELNESGELESTLTPS